MGVFYPDHHCHSGCEEPHGVEHSDECICESCHEYHIEEGIQNYDGLECCTDLIDYYIETKETWCGYHRLPFADTDNTWCSGCELDQAKLEAMIENEIDYNTEVKHETDQN